MKSFGLIGHPLGHSFSKKYFENKFENEHLDCSFSNFDLESLDNLDKMISENNLQGFTITYPYKNEIIEHLDFIDENAKEIGAVNVVKIDSDRKLHGFNSDYIGFQGLLEDAIQDREIGRALILGTGGASKAVSFVLKNKNIDFQFITRNVRYENQKSYNELKKEGFHDNELIINATPIGMHPNANNCLDLPFETLNPSNILIDLIYNPEETIFLKRGKSQGAKTFNGLKMLYLQADAAWEIWEKEQS